MSDGFDFAKSSYSNQTGECVEVALNLPRTVAVRDSKHQAGPVVRVTPAAWDAFRAGLRAP
ncbi:hypothetical protein CU044_7189 [Streptomyces sp. L-9-10]|uniref:DUF397 domain-containing protein n=1 Tax=Streptomyces sp. L-9-10 TaxID=1478131 RepID=UPI00101CC483|nr:DUF397 domain-containing protein [Streptomyces sp. L-9-10]RYJ20391.1 hypothetical protein CU044_7189 [Streptomyces sp. L-9-10]